MLTPLETGLIALLLVVLMFGMGTTLTPARFREVLAHPQAFLIGTASQFLFMPLCAYGLAKALHLSDAAALGLVIMGTCPGGTTSNLFAHLAHADVALSVSMTAASKVIGIFMMPLCLFVLGREFTSESVAIPYKEIVKALLALLVPVAIGMGLRRKYGERFAEIAEKVGSIAGIVVLVAVIAITTHRNRGLFFTTPAAHYVAAAALGITGMAFGNLAARLFKLPVAKRRAVSFETGVQNSALCFAIILTTFPPAAAAELMPLPLLCALFILMEATLVTVIIRRLDARAAAAPAAT